MSPNIILYHSPNSPYVRKVVIAARELQLDDQLDIVRSVTSPLQKTILHTHLNPLGKVPTFELRDTGRVYFGSQVCSAYLDAISEVRHIYPSDSLQRCDALTVETICDGILDAAISLRYEHSIRPEEKRWTGWDDAMMNKIHNGLEALNDRIDTNAKGLSLPDPNVDVLPIHGIAPHATLWYLALRFPDIDIGQFPKLKAWGEAVAKRQTCSGPH